MIELIVFSFLFHKPSNMNFNIVTNYRPTTLPSISSKLIIILLGLVCNMQFEYMINRTYSTLYSQYNSTFIHTHTKSFLMIYAWRVIALFKNEQNTTHTQTHKKSIPIKHNNLNDLKFLVVVLFLLYCCFLPFACHGVR